MKIIIFIFLLLTSGCVSFTNTIPTNNSNAYTEVYRDDKGNYSYIIQCRISGNLCMKAARKVCPVGFVVLQSNEINDETGYYGWIVISHDNRKCYPIKNNIKEK